MTIDPKAAELAKALADAVAAQNTPEYQELAKAAERKAEIDAAAENAAFALSEHYAPIRQGVGVLGGYSGCAIRTSVWVTDEMIEAGVRQLELFKSDHSDHELASLVYNAMYLARPDYADPCIDQPTPEPERYELPEDETATAKPNGGLTD